MRAPPLLTKPAKPAPRYEIRTGKFGQYFHDTERGGREGFDMPLALVLDKLNEIPDLKARLAKANKGRPLNKTF